MSEDQVNAAEVAGEGTDPAEPEPSAVHQAVVEAIEDQKPEAEQIHIAPCPCGEEEVELGVELPPGQKVGRSVCGACGVWGVEFLAPRSKDQNLIARAAAKAWNEAPRA